MGMIPAAPQPPPVRDAGLWVQPPPPNLGVMLEVLQYPSRLLCRVQEAALSPRMLCCCLILGPQHGEGGRALISPLSPPSRGVGAVYKSTLSREPEVLQMLGCLWDGSCSTGWESCCHRNAPGQEWDFFAPWRNPSAENGSGGHLNPPSCCGCSVQCRCMEKEPQGAILCRAGDKTNL